MFHLSPSPATEEKPREFAYSAKGRAEALAYWLSQLSPSDRAIARKLGLNKPLSDTNFRRLGAEEALEMADCEPIPEGSIRGRRNGHAILHGDDAVIDAIEPRERSEGVEGFQAAIEVFSNALRWALDASGDEREHRLVALGKRSAVIITCMRGDLASGLIIDKKLARSFIESFQDDHPSETIEALVSAGDMYCRILEWMRRATSISGLGERLQLVAYELRPDLIDAGTLAQLGEQTKKTRQATNKRVNSIRDTFAGLKALTMRGDFTRNQCRVATRFIEVSNPKYTCIAKSTNS